MSKLLPGLAVGISLAAFPLAAVILPVVAQEQTATVTISDAFAAELSTASGVPVGAIPRELVVSLALAQAACADPALLPGATCTGVSVEGLAALLQSSSNPPSSEESSEPDNSAKAFAPGHLKGDGESAKQYAPGHNKGDSGNAKDQSPGHQKKADDGAPS